MKRFIPFLNSTPLVAVIRLSGVISTGGRGQSLNDADLAGMIEKAFRKGKPKAVALIINSPGGSPAQSSLIAARIRRLSEEKDVPVHAFVEDVAASGGYWLACAADHIWLDPNSIVGSIGVISASFGLDDFISRYGIERRVHTAGKDKSMLDPFRPERKEDVARLKSIQSQIHEGFIDWVKTRRGDRLAENDDLFSGEFWVGAKGVELGLADGIAHLHRKMKDIYGEKTRFAAYGQKRGLLQRFGTQITGQLVGAVEDRAIWSRYGL